MKKGSCFNHRRKQQRCRSSACAQHAGRWRRGCRFARRTGRDRRIIPHSGCDGEVGRDAARGGHDQSHTRCRLREGHQRPDAAAAARASFKLRDHRIHGAGFHRRLGGTRPAAGRSVDGRSGERRASGLAKFRHHRRAQRARQLARWSRRRDLQRRQAAGRPAGWVDQRPCRI